MTKSAASTFPAARAESERPGHTTSEGIVGGSRDSVVMSLALAVVIALVLGLLVGTVIGWALSVERGLSRHSDAVSRAAQNQLASQGAAAQRAAGVICGAGAHA